MPAGVVPAWYRETILSIALREGFHRCARVAVGHPKNPKKLCLPRKSLACPVLARCLPVVASLLARLSRPRQDGLERSGEGEREGGREGLSHALPERRALRQARSFSIFVSSLRLLRADHYRLGRVSCYNIETSAGLAYAAPAMRWRAAETFNFCAFLRLEDLRRSSEAG